MLPQGHHLVYNEIDRVFVSIEIYSKWGNMMRQKNADIKSISIRMPNKILQELHYISNYEGSTNSQVLYLVRECIDNFKKKNGKINLNENEKQRGR